ncbi:aldo/keto reductase [Ruegeria sp.]|uniref:aldo/keto reductase n=1 Tax=Ruegeria sp. TaxID=1879320 RepID=UPI003B5A298D
MTVSQTDLLNHRTARPVPLTRMGFGGAPLGNLYRKVSDQDAQAALQAAFDAGIRFFDTAPQYGLGRSEYRFGEAMRRFGRENVSCPPKSGGYCWIASLTK